MAYKNYYQRNLDKERKRHRDYQKANPGKIRDLKLKSQYGLTPEDYDNLLKKQKNCCAICGTSKSKLKRGLFVDHDHKTKEVRGLLCQPCNNGLGAFKDSFVNLENAAKYLSPIKQTSIDVLSICRRSFLSVIGLSSHILNAMSDEMEAVRSNKGMQKEVKTALRQLLSAHIQNVATLGHAISNCVVDPMDPEGTKLSDLH